MKLTFYDWLIEVKEYKHGTASSRVANAKKVQDSMGDLSEHFIKDNCKSLLRTLVYSMEDERRGKPTLHNIPINGVKRTATSTYRQTVNLVVEYYTDYLKKK